MERDRQREWDKRIVGIRKKKVESSAFTFWNKRSKQNTDGIPSYFSNSVPEHTKLISEEPFKLDEFPVYYFLSALFPSSDHTVDRHIQWKCLFAFLYRKLGKPRKNQMVDSSFRGEWKTSLLLQAWSCCKKEKKENRVLEVGTVWDRYSRSNREPFGVHTIHIWNWKGNTVSIVYGGKGQDNCIIIMCFSVFIT